jgi:hypothetical protein
MLKPIANGWTAARAEQWRAHLAGMEAMLAPVDEPLLRALNLDAPYRIADIEGGGGGTTMEILCRAPAGKCRSRFDLSQALIELARGRERSEERAIAFDGGRSSSTGFRPDCPIPRRRTAHQVRASVPGWQRRQADRQRT